MRPLPPKREVVATADNSERSSQLAELRTQCRQVDLTVSLAVARTRTDEVSSAAQLKAPDQQVRPSTDAADRVFRIVRRHEELVVDVALSLTPEGRNLSGLNTKGSKHPSLPRALAQRPRPLRTQTYQVR